MHEWTKYSTVSTHTMYRPMKAFIKKVSHQRHANSERSHNISLSLQMVLMYVRSPAWWVFKAIWRLQNSYEWIVLSCSVDHASSELSDLQSDSLLAEHFKSDFYSSLKEENFAHIRTHTQKMLALLKLRSTFKCKQTFSLRKLNKSWYRCSQQQLPVCRALHSQLRHWTKLWNQLVKLKKARVLSPKNRKNLKICRWNN